MRKIIKIKAKNFFAKIQKLILADTHYSKKICFFTNYNIYFYNKIDFIQESR